MPWKITFVKWIQIVVYGAPDFRGRGEEKRGVAARGKCLRLSHQAISTWIYRAAGVIRSVFRLLDFPKSSRPYVVGRIVQLP